MTKEEEEALEHLDNAKKKGWKRKKWNENFRRISLDCKSDEGRKIEKLGPLRKKRRRKAKKIPPGNRGRKKTQRIHSYACSSQGNVFDRRRSR